MREDEGSIDLGRSRGDKDDYKRQAAEMRGALKEKATQLKEQVVSGEMSTKIKTATEPVVEKAKDIIEQGRQKMEEIRASYEPGSSSESSKEARIYSSEQPGSVPQANILGLSSPIAEDSESSSQIHRPVHHTSAADFSFSSIPDSTSSGSRVRHKKASSVADRSASSGLDLPFSERGHSGDPIPSSVGMFETVGMDAAEGIEYIKSLAEPQIQKAKSLYSLWKNEDKRVTENAEHVAAPNSGSEPTMMEKAQQIYSEKVLPAAAAAGEKVASVYHSSVEPTVAAVQEQVGIAREDGIKKTMDRASAAYQRRMGSAKASMKQTYEAKVPPAQREQIRKRASKAKTGVLKTLTRIKNKALDIWEGEEPMIREKMQQGVALINRYNLGIPLMFLGTLLVLWASFSFVAWMAFPAHPNEHLPVLYEPQFKPSTGPIQTAELPGFGDKLRMKVDGLDSQIRDGIADLKERATHAIPSMGDIKDRAVDAMPSMGDIKERAGDLKDRVLERMPSVEDIKDQAADVRDRVVDSKIVHSAQSGLGDLKDRVVDAMPSVEQVKDGVRKQAATASAAMPTLSDIKDRAADGLESARASLKYPDTAAPVHASATPGLLHTVHDSNLGMKVQDRLHHVADAVTPDFGKLRQRVVDFRDQLLHKLTPEQRHAHYVATGQVLDPDNHVVEQLDEHLHVKETIQV